MSTTQTRVLLNTATRYKAFIKDVMKCKDDVVEALEDYQGIVDVETFGEFESEEWNGVVKQFLSPPMKSGGTVPSSNNYGLFL